MRTSSLITICVGALIAGFWVSDRQLERRTRINTPTKTMKVYERTLSRTVTTTVTQRIVLDDDSNTDDIDNNPAYNMSDKEIETYLGHAKDSDDPTLETSTVYKTHISFYEGKATADE